MYILEYDDLKTILDFIETHRCHHCENDKCHTKHCQNYLDKEIISEYIKSVDKEDFLIKMLSDLTKLKKFFMAITYWKWFIGIPNNNFENETKYLNNIKDYFLGHTR